MWPLKSVFDKVMGRLPGRSHSSSDSMDGSENAHELDIVSRTHQETTCTLRDDLPSPSPPCTPVERMDTPEEDEVLFRKNNVFLSYPKPVTMTYEASRFYTHERTPSPQMSLSESSNSNSSGSFQDNQVLVPGYLFIRTRGSNYGTTLILNWAPNSSMKVPAPSHTPSPPLIQPPSTCSPGTTTAMSASFLANGGQVRTGGQTGAAGGGTTVSAGDRCRSEVSNVRTNKYLMHTEYTDGDAIVVSTTSEVPPSAVTGSPGRGDTVATGGGVGGVGVDEGSFGYDRPSCSSVSIDLGMMEMIRIFYNTDYQGFMVSGEMVIRSKDRNFKVSPTCTKYMY